MRINSQKELDELVQKYTGKIATDKLNGEKFEIGLISLNLENTFKGIEEFATVNLIPLDPNSKESFKVLIFHKTKKWSSPTPLFFFLLKLLKQNSF